MADYKYTPADFKSDQEVRWCPGCGDHAILSAVQRALPEIADALDTPHNLFTFVSGIGCSSRFIYYMKTYGFHSVHGRANAVAMSLQKGQKISLTKGNEGLSKVIIGLGWDEAAKSKGGLFGSLFGSSGPAIDCDASAFVLQNGKLTDKKDIVYFGNLKHYTGTVQHMGDNLTGAGEGDDEQIVVDLARVPAEYDRIVLVVNIYQAVQRRQHFGMIQNAFIRIVDARNNQEMCRYNLSENYDNMTAMIFGEVYRNNGEWKFNAIGQATTDPGLVELARRYM